MRDYDPMEEGFRTTAPLCDRELYILVAVAVFALSMFYIGTLIVYDPTVDIFY